MKTFVVALAFLVQAAAAPPPVLPAVCSVASRHVGSDAIVARSTTLYVCETGHAAQTVPVDKHWFKSHCTKPDAAHDAYGTVAQCDAWAPADAAVPPDEIAKPSALKRDLKIAGYSALAAALIVGCAYSNSCGFMK